MFVLKMGQKFGKLYVPVKYIEDVHTKWIKYADLKYIKYVLMQLTWLWTQ